MELWQQIVALTLTPTLLVGALAYLLRALFDRGLERDLERHKSELAAQLFEYQTKFSVIHEKRAEVIAELYSRLARARRELAQLTAALQPGGQSLHAKKQQAADACNEAAEFFNERRLYMDLKTSEKIDRILETMKSAFYDFNTAQQEDEYKPDPSGLGVQASKQVRDDLPPLLRELEGQFQNILGIVEENTKWKK